MLTGWACFRKLNVLGFPISDHSDFYGLIKFIEEVNPKKVFVVHGYTKEFASEIKKRLKIEAVPIDETNQRYVLKSY